MRIWEAFRISLLVVTSVGALWVLGESILGLDPKSQTFRPFVFPFNMPLPHWNFVDSQPLVDPTGRIYSYRQNNFNLQIEARYVDHPHLNEKMFRLHDPNRFSETKLVHPPYQKENTGFYSLLVKNERAYLESCINPRGISVITYDQFIHNRYTSDLQFNRFLPWLLGQEPLRDHRCLWTHMSIPLNGVASEQLFPILETAWVFWYQRWKENFPKP